MIIGYKRFCPVCCREVKALVKCVCQQEKK